jgi:hypothetical protein
MGGGAEAGEELRPPHIILRAASPRLMMHPYAFASFRQQSRKKLSDFLMRLTGSSGPSYGGGQLDHLLADLP